LEEVLRERVFVPIGMHATMLRRFDTDFVSNSATLHMTRPGGGYIKSYLGCAIAGEGGIVSTVDDMLRWLAHMDAPVVGSSATWAAMRTPQKLTNGVPTDYGLGLVIERYRGVELVSHSGGGMGGNSMMIKVPAAGLDLIVFVNRGDVDAPVLADRVLDECLPGLDKVGKWSRALASGTFRSPKSGRVIQLLAQDGRQVCRWTGTISWSSRIAKASCDRPGFIDLTSWR
jgi:CubicO group peptidase (beta-lactamase class C family)